MAKQYRKVLDETFGTQIEIIEDIEASEGGSAVGVEDTGDPASSRKKRAISAKSHIFRKGKIENK